MAGTRPGHFVLRERMMTVREECARRGLETASLIDSLLKAFTEPRRDPGDPDSGDEDQSENDFVSREDLNQREVLVFFNRPGRQSVC